MVIHSYSCGIRTYPVRRHGKIILILADVSHPLFQSASVTWLIILKIKLNKIKSKFVMQNKKQKKLSPFEEAMKKIATTKKTEVDKAIQKDKGNKKPLKNSGSKNGSVENINKKGQR